MFQLAELPFFFEKPYWLVLLILLVPTALMAYYAIGSVSRTKAWLSFILRALVICLLTLTLAEPHWAKRGKGLTVMMLIDRSQSIPLPRKREAVEFLREATKLKELDDDRIGVITIAKDANIVAMPDRYSAVPGELDQGDLTATNLAQGLNLAFATTPDDTATRFILASDGNETMDSVMAAAEIAKANDIPIDVLPLEYDHSREIVFDQLTAPSHARQGSTITLKMVMRSQSPATGSVVLRMDDIDLDLNGEAEGNGLRVELEPGPPKVIPLTLSVDSPGAKRFDATFVPDDPAADFIAQNNRAVAVTFVSGGGRVLVIDDSLAATEAAPLIAALRQSGISVDVKSADAALLGGSVAVAPYDAIILANIPRFVFNDQQDLMLHAYVHDLGGGLVMLGGPESFGAGAWIDSQLSRALPVKLDPPQTRQMPRGALALVMHSCEMPQGNFWGQTVAEAAIKALSRLDYVGIVDYDYQRPGAIGWAFPLQEAGDKTAAIAATKKMLNGDMPDFDASMQTAYDGLTTKAAAQKHIICISDGDPSWSNSGGLLQKMKSAAITITMIMIAGHGSPADKKKMTDIATTTGGRFYEVTNPKKLPEIFIKEAQMVARSLIVEGDIYQPEIVSSLPGPLEGIRSVPAIDGYVLTAPREGLAQVPIVNATTDAVDPIYAYWNYGIGKSIAFTSDATGRWAERWLSWADFKNFWEQSIRWVMRPSELADMNVNMTVNTRLEGDRALVEVEALDIDAAFLNFLQTSPVVIHPDGTTQPLSLQQVGPGRYRGEFRVEDEGAYLVNVNYALARAEGDPARGNVQAAVCVPYAREFRAIKHNTALLKELADRTGGRVITMGDPQLADIFNREGLEVPRSAKRIWDLLVILAACLLIFDVAARRLSFDQKAMKASLARAVGRRQESGEQTVEAWKKARSQVAHRRDDAVEPVDRSAKFEATEADAVRAIDVGAEAPKDRRPASPQVQLQSKAEEPPSAEDEDYTSRLLKAKRRARGETDKPAGGERSDA